MVCDLRAVVASFILQHANADHAILKLFLQVSQLPEDDIVSMTRQEMHARLVVAMGGRAAEERIFGACIQASKCCVLCLSVMNI